LGRNKKIRAEKQEFAIKREFQVVADIQLSGIEKLLLLKFCMEANHLVIQAK
jgi:hypothetical protein